MNMHCPICGHAFSPLDVMLSELQAGYQYHHCWNRVRATGAGMPAFRIHGQKKPRILTTRRKAGTSEKKP